MVNLSSSSQHTWPIRFASLSEPGRYPTAIDVLRDGEYGDGETPRPLVELDLLALEGAMRDRKGWWEKVNDETIVSKWREESGCDKNSPKFNFAIAEVRWQAQHYPGPARPAAVEGVFSFDDLSEPLLKRLLEGADRIRVESKRDVHPGSDGLVIDLVHPSMYAYHQGVTPVEGGADRFEMPVWTEFACSNIAKPEAPCEKGDIFMCSKHGLAWLPAEFALSSDGKSCKINSYINSLHPETYADMYDAIADAFVEVVPLFEGVLAELGTGKTQRETPLRVTWRSEDGEPTGHLEEEFEEENNDSIPENECSDMDDSNNMEDEDNDNGPNHVDVEGEVTDGTLIEDNSADMEDRESSHSLDAHDDDEEAADDNLIYVAPENNAMEHDNVQHLGMEIEGEEEEDDDEDDSGISRMEPPEILPEFVPYALPEQVSLKGMRLQVIVKIASIELTPDKPKYPGGSWHVEGMRNERIVATACLYLDSDNIGETALEFRTAIREPDYSQDDHAGVRDVYGLVNDGPLVQERGVCRTLARRVLAWPNTLQHRVRPFELDDNSRPGRRTILCFFLVDPTLRVRSTATVPPQNNEWLGMAARRGLPHELPDDVKDRVTKHLGGLTYQQACERRQKLMDERKTIVEGCEDIYGLGSFPFFERPFSLCEH